MSMVTGPSLRSTAARTNTGPTLKRGWGVDARKTWAAAATGSAVTARTTSAAGTAARQTDRCTRAPPGRGSLQLLQGDPEHLGRLVGLADRVGVPAFGVELSGLLDQRPGILDLRVVGAHRGHGVGELLDEEGALGGA